MNNKFYYLILSKAGVIYLFLHRFTAELHKLLYTVNSMSLFYKGRWKKLMCKTCTFYFTF